jgi:hypothetical protein
MYIRGSNSPAAVSLFFLLHTTSCAFPNTISFSLLSPVPSLPVLIVVLPSPRVPVLVASSSRPSHTPVRIAKGRVSRHALYLCRVAILPESAAASEFLSAPRREFPGFHTHSLPVHYITRSDYSFSLAPHYPTSCWKWMKGSLI